MRRVAAIGLATTLAACGSVEAKNAVKDQLIDPESAQFYDVSSKNGATCGFVNSRNRMGGYAGRQAFIYEGGIAEIYSDPDAAFIEKFGSKCPNDVVLKFIQQRVGQ
jgi:hypothetical protein